MNLDIEFVRAYFNQLADHEDFVFCSNAGGSYVANPVNRLLNHYNSHHRVQPYERYPASAQAGRAMDYAINGWADALNISADELTIGPSTSMNTYVLAQAIAAQLHDSDEIIVTNQDHEANNGVWRRIAESRNARIREWRVDAETGLLDEETLRPLLNRNTRWVFFTHCSNISGTVNPVKSWTRTIRALSTARVFVDGVSYAPHHIPDLKELGVDGYIFSLYKVFGPHQSLMFVDSATTAELTPQCHFFNTGFQQKLFNPAGPQHAQVAACAGVLEYFDALHQHHFNAPDKSGIRSAGSQKLQDIQRLILRHENELARPILQWLNDCEDIRLIGKTHADDLDRAPTIAFKLAHQSSWDFAAKLQSRNIGCESGNFYAWRLMQGIGLDPEDGVVRISLVHYSSGDDVSRILDALEYCIAH